MITSGIIGDQTREVELKAEFYDKVLYIHKTNPVDCDQCVAVVCIQDGTIKVVAHPNIDENVTTEIEEDA